MKRLPTLVGMVAVGVVLWLSLGARSSATTQPTDPPILGPIEPIFDPTSDDEIAARDEQIADLRRELRREHRRYLSARRHYLSAQRHYLYARGRSLSLVRTLRHTPSVVSAIGLACTVYGSCSTLQRRAYCESHYSPTAQNASGASGLFQFLPSTWRSTPFGGFSVFDPYANALAAGWMESRGRGGEFVCR